MKNITKLAFVSALFVSSGTQAATIGAAVAGGLWSGDMQDGGIGSNTAYVAGDQTSPTAYPSIGAYSYRSQASFNIGELTPELRAVATFADQPGISDPNIRAEAFGLQTYQNISAFTQTYTLDLSLHGILRSAPQSYIDAEVGIFAGTSLSSSASSCGGSAEYLQGFSLWACGNRLGTGLTPYIEISGDGETTVLDSVSFNVGAGETFTIYAELLALTFGGSADAFSTLGMTFEDKSTIVALGDMSAVPVPAAAWLFTSGLIGLVAVSRRKTRA